MKNSTYRRRRNTVPAWKKSAGQLLPGVVTSGVCALAQFTDLTAAPPARPTPAQARPPDACHTDAAWRAPPAAARSPPAAPPQPLLARLQCPGQGILQPDVSIRLREYASRDRHEAQQILSPSGSRITPGVSCSAARFPATYLSSVLCVRPLSHGQKRRWCQSAGS
jgi:hypothetical protein